MSTIARAWLLIALLGVATFAIRAGSLVVADRCTGLCMTRCRCCA